MVGGRFVRHVCYYSVGLCEERYRDDVLVAEEVAEILLTKNTSGFILFFL